MAGILTYKNAAHATIYKNFLLNSPYKYGGRFLGALFLLTVNRDVWPRAKRAIVGKEIYFERINLRGLTSFGYALVIMAQDIYDNTSHVNLFDLSDTYLLSEKAIKIILSAITVAREGYDAIGISKEFT